MMKLTVKLALPLLIGMAAGCTTMGSGYGSTLSGAHPVHFNWTSSNNVSGTMSATLSNGDLYSGQFFQVTSNTTVDSLGPLWVGWGGGWRGNWRGGGWGYWNAAPDFVTHYSGRVVANLAGPDGKHIRCNFELVRPTDGMAGGGRGQCQLPKGSTIDTTFPSV